MLLLQAEAFTRATFPAGDTYNFQSVSLCGHELFCSLFSEQNATAHLCLQTIEVWELQTIEVWEGSFVHLQLALREQIRQNILVAGKSGFHAKKCKYFSCPVAPLLEKTIPGKPQSKQTNV